MKTLKLIMVFGAALLMTTACTKNENNPGFGSLKSAGVETTIVDMSNVVASVPGDPADWCGYRSLELIGGQYYPMGTVEIFTYDGLLYVRYTANPGCTLEETHVFVGDEYPNDGPPAIGHFPVKWERGSSEAGDVVIHAIALTDWDVCVDIIAHAVVSCGGQQETAFARGGDVVVAIKWNTGSWNITGSEDCGTVKEDWCNKMSFEMLDLSLEEQDFALINLYGCLNTRYLKVDKAGNTLYFSIVDDQGNEVTPLDPEENVFTFVGSESEFYAYDLCNNGYRNFPYKFEATIDEVVTSVPFDGPRWGWFIDEYCPSECLQDD